MITFDRDNSRFSFRSCAIFINNGRVLLHRLENADFWALPGGRVEMHENADSTVIREMKEEIGENIKIERLLWVLENFFNHENKYYHELSLLFLVNFERVSKLVKLSGEFYGNEDAGQKLIFKWFPVNKLKKVPLYPIFLRTKLTKLPKHIEYIKHIDKP